MNVSKLKIVWKYLTGGMGSVVDHLLDLLNTALSKIDGSSKIKLQAVLNTAEHVLSVLVALEWLCPTKWQTAYKKTIIAVGTVIDALKDLTITAKELEKVRDDFAIAVEAWKSPDDDTCIDCIDVDCDDCHI